MSYLYCAQDPSVTYAADAVLINVNVYESYPLADWLGKDDGGTDELSHTGVIERLST